MIVLADWKSGYVDQTTDYQLGAYARCEVYQPRRELPKIEKGLILRVNDQGCQPIWLPEIRLFDAGEKFLGLLDVYKDLTFNGTKNGVDVYQLVLEEATVTYPRVTSILKTVLNKDRLTQWQVKRAVEYTLLEMKRTKRTPDEVLDALRDGMFDPMQGARLYMEAKGKNGTAIHACIQSYLLGHPVMIEPDNAWLHAAFNNHFLPWAEQHKLRLVDELSEVKVFNREHGYAGTLDGIVSVEE